VTVSLLSVAFNHDPSSARADAINLRHNGDLTGIQRLPEWRAGAGLGQRDSRAAYALAETAGNQITIEAQLSCDNPRTPVVDVRAVEPHPPTPPLAWLQQMFGFLVPAGPFQAWQLFLLWGALARPRPGLLGSVEAREVRFGADGRSGPLPFALRDVRMWERGVGVHAVNWRWEARESADGPWQPIATTHHTIYTILSLPTEPWMQQPFDGTNTQLPWTEVLDRACSWAQGSRTAHEAATRITRALYDLGPELIQYDCPGGGGTHYTWFEPYAVFDCTAFLRRLEGGFGWGPYVNCIDCASIVSTFANVLGADLSQSGMGSGIGAPFRTNPIRALGSPRWRTPCDWGEFGYHEVAWTGACGSDDEVVDACLEVDA